MIGGDAWLSFSSPTIAGALLRVENSEEFPKTVIPDPHLARLKTLQGVLDTSGQTELGFMLNDAECDFGTMTDGTFVPSGFAVARDFDLQNAGRTCEAFKQILGYILMGHVGACSVARQTSRLRSLSSTTGDLVYAVYHPPVKDDQTQAAVSMTWDQLSRGEQVAVKATEDLAWMMGYAPREGGAAKDGVSIAVPGTVSLDIATGTASWAASPSALQHVPQDAQGLQSLAGLTFNEVPSGVLRDGATLTYANVSDQLAGASFVPAGAPLEIRQMSSDGATSSVREQPDLLITRSERDRDISESFVAAMRASQASGVVPFYAGHAAAKENITFEAGLLSRNPILDRYLAQSDMDVSELPEGMAAVFGLSEQ